MFIHTQRSLFDIPNDVCYLNAAYMTPLTKKQTEIGGSGMAKSARPWNYSEQDFFTDVEGVRGLAAQILTVSSHDIAIVPSASYGTATAGLNMPVKQGQVILMVEDQFPSNVYEWTKLAEEAGAELAFVKTPDNHDWTTAIVEAIQEYGEKIAFAALANVHWASGAKLDLGIISPALKKIGAGLVLDLTQSVGAMPINLAEIDPDFAVCASYKWMMGPYGLGVLYVAPRHQHGKPIEQNWINRQGSENFANLVNYQDQYQEGARRFDFGERSNFILMPVYKEGLRQLLEWGISNISFTLGEINRRIETIALNNGLRSIDSDYRSPHMMGIELGGDAERYAAKLRAENIFVSIRGSMLRVAPHLWVNDHDMERFEKVMTSL
ncbi:aminotransferase class V-fold PLP-dependent enzyme [Kordiimonas sp. SCSIO 12610]|uniref:aminotransferase class V-fold PLP-dependent enzyme n=1 Tax=Kordiimonas sp. SCSIO 12610 TaxID=2829597 RepID=UPI00210A8CDD|nr:aminotransferase class V-fold PLP-dependent enzyme [Kordiimonas sp. SCSIO 12610]UTW56742.1 aminotransferase class V-fold PLP-dependent enzyme [Kordiimonas sp. SCSIO 12610]